MSKQLLSVIQHLREYDWRPVLPLAIFQGVYAVFMPWRFGYEYSALEPHQQALSALAFPVALLTVLGFIWLNDIPAKPSPEDQILDDSQ